MTNLISGTDYEWANIKVYLDGEEIDVMPIEYTEHKRLPRKLKKRLKRFGYICTISNIRTIKTPPNKK
jgi:hypothetical protein